MNVGRLSPSHVSYAKYVLLLDYTQFVYTINYPLVSMVSKYSTMQYNNRITAQIIKNCKCY